MNKSEPILPLRFYDDLFDQQRFSKFCADCVDCQLNLVYPSNDKPHFQFTRKSKLTVPTMFYLRNTCRDKEFLNYKVIPEAASNFSTVEATDFFGEFPKGGIYHIPDAGHGDDISAFAIDINCGNLVPAQPRQDCAYVLSSAFITVPVSDNQLYKFKLVVDKLFKSTGSAFVIKIYTGGVGGSLIAAITAPGVYIYDIFTYGDSDITVAFEAMECDDDFSISFIQATTMLFDTNLTGDIILDHTKLRVVPMSDGTDIVVYCGDFSNNTISIPNGDYYYVVYDGPNYYVSEVFSIISLREIENHYKLTWWNTCDISKYRSVLYDTKNIDCEYRNVLYLDAGLFNPEYDTTEEGDENGAGDINVNFQKWRKNLNFEIGKSPEFLTDALTAIFLHDNIFVKKPLNHYQDVLNNEYKVIKITNNVSTILGDCFQKVNLKFLLEDKFIDTGCCTESIVFDCTPCKYVAADNCESGAAYYLLLPPAVGVHGLHQCSNDAIVPVKPTDIICYNDKLLTLEQDEFGNYELGHYLPEIANVSLVFFLFFADIYLVPFSFGQVEYNKNGAGWLPADTIQSNDSTGYVSYAIPFWIFVGPPTTDLKIRVKNVSLKCDFGYSEVYDVI